MAKNRISAEMATDFIQNMYPGWARSYERDSEKTIWELACKYVERYERCEEILFSDMMAILQGDDPTVSDSDVVLADFANWFDETYGDQATVW